MMPMQRGGCWRWPWCLKDISGAKPASSAAWTVPARLGSTLQRRRHRRALQPHSGWTETTAHSRAGGDSSRAGSQRTRPCQTWRGALAPGGFGPRDQDAVQCDLGRAQRRRDAAPPRLSAAVGATATSPTGSCGAEGAQKNFADLVKAAIPEHAREKPIELWWQDEARVGQQGTLTRVWAERGSRPPAPRDQRREWAYIFGAVCPRRDIGAALVLPYANAHAINLHLEEISCQVTQGSHAVLLLDGAGWHQTGGKLRVPKNVSLLHPPPYSPELHPVENIWQFLRQNHLGNRVFESYAAIVDACCAAWNALVAEPGRITSITTRHWASVIT